MNIGEKVPIDNHRNADTAPNGDWKLLIADGASLSGRQCRFSPGMTQSSRIIEGEWWRLIISLTLHAFALHAASTIP